MEYLQFSVTDYVLFGFIIVLNCFLGLYYGWYKKQTTTNAYFFGDQKMLLLPIAASLAASSLSAQTIIGIPSEVYMYGTQICLLPIAIVIVGIINHFVYLPMFYKLGLNSIFHYLELRFSRSVKNIVCITFIVKHILMIPVFFYVSGMVFSVVTGINTQVVVWTIACICIFYTSLGGLRAVVWTDALELIITCFTIIFVVIKSVDIVGGPMKVWQKASEGERLEFFNFNPDPTIRATFWSITIGNIFLWLDSMVINPANVQRSRALPSLSKAKGANFIYIVITALTKCFGFIIGITLYARYAHCDPLSSGRINKIDQIVPFFVMDVSRKVPGIVGLFVAGIFTATFSTVSTTLNTLSKIIYFDIFLQFFPQKELSRKTSTILKLLTALIGLAGAALVFFVQKLGTYFEMKYILYGVTGGPMLGVFTLGFVFPFANNRGALMGITLSFMIMLCIIVQQQISINAGAIRYTTKPLNLDGCNSTFPNTTTLPLQDQPFWLFRITFHYFTLCGAVLTIFIGGIASMLVPNKDGMNAEADLVLPCVRHFIPPCEIKSSDEKEVSLILPKEF